MNGRDREAIRSMANNHVCVCEGTIEWRGTIVYGLESVDLH